MSLRSILLWGLWLVPAIALAAPDPPAVAILYFDYDGQDAELGLLKKGLTQMLISDLADNAAIRVVERERLEAVLAELKLQSSRKIDPTSAAKAGKLLGASYLVLGSYFEVMKTLRTDARVVEVETGLVVTSVGAASPRDDFLATERQLATNLGRFFTSSLPARRALQEKARKKQRPKAPAALKLKTAVEYGRALSALDHGDRQGAKRSLQQVIAQQPDFELATIDLDRLMR